MYMTLRDCVLYTPTKTHSIYLQHIFLLAAPLSAFLRFPSRSLAEIVAGGPHELRSLLFYSSFCTTLQALPVVTTPEFPTSLQRQRRSIMGRSEGERQEPHLFRQFGFVNLGASAAGVRIPGKLPSWPC